MTTSNQNNLNQTGIVISILFILATIVLTKLIIPQQNSSPNHDLAVEKIPLQLGPWQGKDTEGLGLRELETLQLDRYLRRIYTDDRGRQIFIYLGYWRQQSGEYQAAKHSPVTCLPANGWGLSGVSQTALSYNSPDKNKLPTSIMLNELTGTFNGNSSLFLYWFFSGEKVYLQEWQALLNIGLGNLLYNRSDGGIVEISTGLSGKGRKTVSKEEAETTIKDFLEHFYPKLESMLGPAQS